MKKHFLIILLIIVTVGSNFYSCENSNEPNPNDQFNDSNGVITICSFNIQFLGHYKKKDNKALADLLKDYDIVVIQELVASPVDGTYLDGSIYTADIESQLFLNEMMSNGFLYILSEEDTGPGDEIHKASTATEWWITFYKDEVVDYVASLPNGFLGDDRSNHPDYERVPYAFPFRIDGTNTDFVLISVHLAPNKSEAERRKHELNSIGTWIANNNQNEDDFIILGDMNLESTTELIDALPDGFISLNDEGYRTNTLINNDADQGAKPYDHIMYNPANTSEEIDEEFDIEVLDLIDLMKEHWTSSDPYPGDPYDHNLFKQYYSDHHPIIFKINY